jgi:hypothetical protein
LVPLIVGALLAAVGSSEISNQHPFVAATARRVHGTRRLFLGTLGGLIPAKAGLWESSGEFGHDKPAAVKAAALRVS